MTNYSLRARMMILILAPTVLIGLLLSIFFVVHRYNDLQRQLEDAGASIIEPLAVSTEYGMSLQNRESIGQLISVLHRRHSDIVRAISVYDENNRLFVTSNFHLDPSSMQLGSNVPFPRQLTVTRDGDIMILRTPIISESYSPDESPSSDAKNSQNMLGYIALELDLKSVRLQQYKEIFISSVMMLFCIGIALIFGWRLMRDVTGPIRNMVNTVDRIRRGQLDSRVEGFMLGELDMLQMLLDFLPEVRNKVEEQLVGENPEGLVDLIHKLHGSCGYSGVPRMKNLCQLIEQQLRSGTKEEDLEPELLELLDEMDNVAREASKILG
ncbi:TPA: Hpt domain-containing protein [Escherichia coli]